MHLIEQNVQLDIKILLWQFQFNYLEVLSIRELSDHKGQLRAADWLSGLSLVSWMHYWPLIGWHQSGLPWGDWLPVVRLGEDLVLMDYLWWGEYQEIRSVHKHCNWHLHQVKQYWLIRKRRSFQFMLMFHSSTKHRCSMLKLKVCCIPVSLTLYFLSVWHNTNSKYNSNPSYFHKIPLQQSRHSEQLRAIRIVQ